MKNTEEKINGLTLISLIVTIIILLILAGLIIIQLTRENGLISKVNLAKERYTIEEAKEKLELAITDLRIEQESKGEQLTKEDLPRINNNEIDVREIENFPIEIICEKYTFNIDENFNITYVGNVEGTIITYTTEPEGYTNKEEVNILITVSNENGIKSIEYPDGDKIVCNGKKKVGIDYTVIANGTYRFKVIDNENKEVVKDVVIYKIDKLEPQDFMPVIEVVKASGFQIRAEAKDAEETEESVKSGIEIYKCYVKKQGLSDLWYGEYESTNGIFYINDLEILTEYDIYVVVYDRANNSKKSQHITGITNGPMDIYIDSNHGSDKTGNGSQKYPFKTLQKITESGVIRRGIIYNIYLQDGNYELPNGNQIIGLDNDRVINIFGNKENTILKLPYEGIGENDGNGGKTDYTLKFYRMVMKLDETERYNYWCSQNNIIFNNIVFDVNAEVRLLLGHFYVGNLDSSFIFNNCISIGKGVALRNDYGEELLTNCYGSFKSGIWSDPTKWDYQTNYITSTPQVDTVTYRIVEDENIWKNLGTGTNPDGSQANLGVYGGEYSWEE